MSVIRDVLAGGNGNYLLPLFWLRGEDETLLRAEVDRVHRAGIGAVCLESRPHPDFCGPLWWRDVDIVMDEARRRGMRVWILDDAHFPTGYARGWVKDKFPEHRKLLLAKRHMDVLGPVPGAALLLRDGLRPDNGWVRSDERLVSVIASHRGAGQAVDDTLLDLTHLVRDNRLWWDIPAGHWRVFFLYETRKGGNLPDYLNPIDPAACRVLIDAVYEPHHARYAADFGKTFAGFFSDESSIANSGAYEDLIGRHAMSLPWRPGMLTLLAERFGGDPTRYLPGLWCDIGPRTWEIRHAFMDLVSRLYGESFGGQLGDWCRQRGVEYIGHIIEDNNAHGRLGGGVAHYYRALGGLDMAGIDVVLWQIKPGQDTQDFSWIAGEADGEFFHYGLAKMGSSLGHIDPRKRGRTMCEIIGAYGWSAGLRLMTWIANHMLVRGVNVFAPHAFSMAEFPDTDCPPHFYARGANAQFRYFKVWSDYANRMCHLLTGGVHVATAAVLYHADAEWSGRSMLFQKPVRVLMQHQIDCDVIPVDTMRAGSEVRDGRLHINGETFACFVVPYAQRLPLAALEICRRWMDAGLPVVFIDALPEEASGAEDCRELLAAIAGHPRCTVAPLETLAELLRQRGQHEIRTATHEPYLRTYHYRSADGRDLLMIFNEHPLTAIATDMTVKIPGPVGSYDAFANRVTALDSAAVADGTRVRVDLVAGESRVLIFGTGEGHRPAPATGGVLPLTGPWQVSTATAEQHPAFTPFRTLESLVNLGLPQFLPNFSGTIRYVTTFTATADTAAELDLGQVFEIADVTLNGTPLGATISPPYRFDLGGAIRNGENRLVIEVTNTLVNQQQDWFSQFHQIDPTGLIGPVVLHLRPS